MFFWKHILQFSPKHILLFFWNQILLFPFVFFRELVLLFLGVVAFACGNQSEEYKQDSYREGAKPCPAQGRFKKPPVVEMHPACEIIPEVLERCFIRFSFKGPVAVHAYSISYYAGALQEIKEEVGQCFPGNPPVGVSVRKFLLFAPVIVTFLRKVWVVKEGGLVWRWLGYWKNNAHKAMNHFVLGGKVLMWSCRAALENTIEEDRRQELD